jgi:ABC-type multidrug transport system fused ATPase/permease subunit
MIDGIDIREFEMRSLHEKFSIVDQNPVLFNATIRDNISYGARLEEQVSDA